MKLLIRLFFAFIGFLFIAILLLATLAPDNDNGHLIIIPIATFIISFLLVVIFRIIRALRRNPRP